jgi:hypothetical protein
MQSDAKEKLEMNASTKVFARRAVAAAILSLASTGACLATKLEILTLGSPGKEFEEWGTALTVSKPRAFKLRWSPTVAGATGADWVVVTKNAQNVDVTVAQGTLTTAPALGTLDLFDVPSFLPPSPAGSKKYFVRITAHDSQLKPLGAASAPVTITYEPASPGIVFDPDLGGPSVGFTEPGHPKIRLIRYDPLTELTPGKLELEVFNEGAQSTNPVQVRISDGHLVVRQEGPPVPVPSLAPGAHKFITFSLRPQLTVGQPTVEGNWAKWRGRAATGFRILAGSAKNGSAFVQWQKPVISGRTGLIVCGFVPETATVALAKTRKCVVDRMRALLANTNGEKGFLLRRVGGATLASQNADLVFEPASAIKVIINFTALSIIAGNPQATNFGTQVNYFQNYVKDSKGADTSCPADSGRATESLGLALSQMMMVSDNRLTEALCVFLGGRARINSMAQSLGMTNTLLQHRIGCTVGEDQRNRLTLNDAARLYSGVADGSLLPTNREAFYSVMVGSGGGAPAFQTIATQEAPDGMPAERIQAFVDSMADHYKPGSYHLSTGENRTTAGSATIPFRVGANIERRDFVYGAFVVKASKGANAEAAYVVSTEILREQIHEALLHW